MNWLGSRLYLVGFRQRESCSSTRDTSLLMSGRTPPMVMTDSTTQIELRVVITEIRAQNKILYINNHYLEQQQLVEAP